MFYSRSLFDVGVMMIYLGSINTDNPVGVSGAVIVEGDTDRTFAGRDPVLFCVCINLKHVGFSGKYRLLPGDTNIGKLILNHL